MRTIILFTMLITIFSCQKATTTTSILQESSTPDITPQESDLAGTILGKWEYVESATEDRNMGVLVILPWPVNALTFNEDGTLLVDTRKDGVLPGKWFLDQENDRYILNSEALFLNETYIQVSDVLRRKMVLTYSNSLQSIEMPDVESFENSKKPTYLYKRAKVN